MKKAKKKNGKGVQESLDFIIEHMATKDDVREIVDERVTEIVDTKVREIIDERVGAIMDEKLQPIREELPTIRTDIKELQEGFDNLKGMPKEIDYALARSSAIEKHLGLKPPVPADAETPQTPCVSR